MAVDINSLVRTIGGQEKVIDKDKAIIDLANEVANGGGGQTQREIKSVWTKNGNTYEKLNLTEDQQGNFYDLVWTTNDTTKKYYLSASETEEPINNNHIATIELDASYNMAFYLPNDIKNLLRVKYSPIEMQNDGIFGSISVYGDNAYDFKFILKFRFDKEHQQ